MIFRSMLHAAMTTVQEATEFQIRDLDPNRLLNSEVQPIQRTHMYLTCPTGLNDV